MNMKRNLPVAAMERILKQVGAERVSEDAKEALRKFVERHAEELSQKAIEFAEHAGRKTVKAEDIELAAKQ